MNWSLNIPDRKSREVISTAVIFLFFFGLGLWVYLPSLDGGFLFDDMSNLTPISKHGGVIDRPTLLAFLTSGQGFPGRSLSLFSFLLDGNSWPLDARTMKMTSLKLHLLAGVLIFWLSWLSSAYLFDPKPSSRVQRIWFAGLLAMLWLLNPYQVSTVSYIVQRMTVLSTIFVLAGLISFVKGRELLQKNVSRGIVLASLGIVWFGVLAVLSKENGVLICVFALLFEKFLFDEEALSDKTKKAWTIWKICILWLPLILLAVYFIYKYDFFTTGYELRTFSVSERLLTQSRILFLYVQDILLPSLKGTGLFSFNQPVSTGLLSPISTLFSIIGIIVACVGSYLIRHRMPLVSLGVLFFFAGHLLESTVIPLEMYFEHRNYLPQYGIWLALCSFLVYLSNRNSTYKKPMTALVCVCILVFSGIAHVRSQLWGNAPLMSKVWYENNISVRTGLLYSSQLVSVGQVSEARSVLLEVSAINPQSLASRLSLAVIDCQVTQKGFKAEEYELLAKTAPIEAAAQEAIGIFSEMLSSGKACKGLTIDALHNITLNYTTNPYYLGYPEAISNLYAFLSDLEFGKRNLDGVMLYRDKACEYFCTPRIRYEQAMFLHTAGLNREAIDHLKKADLLHGRYSQLKDPHLSEQIESARKLLVTPKLM